MDISPNSALCERMGWTLDEFHAAMTEEWLQMSPAEFIHAVYAEQERLEELMMKAGTDNGPGAA